MILVTGGTGFVGQNVVQELLRRGHRVRLLVRRLPAAGTFPSGAQIEFVPGDALKPESLSRAMIGVDVVINLIGLIAETPMTTFHQIHVEATQNLLTAAQQAGVTRWIQMSAIGVRARGRSHYQTTKWEGEEIVRESGLDWTLFRPSMIYGNDENDRLINLLGRALSFPLDLIQLDTFPVLDGGLTRVQPVNVREVAHCVVAALTRQASIGATYELVGPEPITWREMIFTVARTLGKDPLYEELPILVALRALLWLMVLVLPPALLLGLAFGSLPLSTFEVGTIIWAFLTVAAWRWRRLIVFSIPSGPLALAASGADELAPRFLRFGEQFRMVEEDNVGDPGPASRTFDYVPESFEEGVKRILSP